MLDLIKQYSDLIVPAIIGILTLYSKTIIKWVEALFSEIIRSKKAKEEFRRKAAISESEKLKGSSSTIKFFFFLREILIENKCSLVAVLDYKELDDKTTCFCAFDYIKEDYHNRIESPRKIYDGIDMSYEDMSYKKLIEENVLVYNDLGDIDCHIKKERLLSIGMSAYVELLVDNKSIVLFFDKPIDISKERLSLIRQEFESKIKYI